MGFNVQAAKQAGYSDEEIQRFLSSQGSSPAPASQPQNTGGNTFLNALEGAVASTPLAPVAALATKGGRSQVSGAASKVADFLGIQNLAKGASQAAFQYTPEAKGLEESLNRRHELDRDILEMARKATQSGNKDKAKKLLSLIGQSDKGLSVENVATDGKGYVSDKQVAGSALNLASTLATAGIGTPSTLAGRVGSGALFGAVSGTGNALNKDEDLSGILSNAATGAGIGAAFPLVAEGTSKVAKGAAKESAEAIYNRLVKTPIKQVEAGKEALGTGLLERGITGDSEKMADKVLRLNAANKEKLASVIEKNADVPISLGGVKQSLVELSEQLKKTPGENNSAVNSVIDQIDYLTRKPITIPEKNPGKAAETIYHVGTDNIPSVLKKGLVPGGGGVADVSGKIDASGGVFANSDLSVAKKYLENQGNGLLYRINVPKSFAGNLVTDANGSKVYRGTIPAEWIQIQRNGTWKGILSGRPISQQKIENALSSGDVATAKDMLAKISPKSAYYQPIKDLVDGNGGTLTLREAQDLKQNLQAAVNDAFLRQNTTGATQAQKVAAQKLRLAIEKAVPDVKPVNKELEFGIRALNQLNRQSALAPSKLRQVTELLLAGYGVTANPAILGGLALEKVATNPEVASRAAQAAYRASGKQVSRGTTGLVERLVAQQGGKL